VCRNISFAYPGEKSKENALRDISFHIPAGSLTVIVGANGSGKSTIIKLLTRMYDADAGALLVDGLPIQRFRVADLRQAQATLTQEHRLYPLSLAENIGLGYAEHVDDTGMIMQAARDGGAAGVLDKLKNGKDTILHPVQTAFGYQLDDEKHKTLKEVLGKLEKATEVSGACLSLSRFNDFKPLANMYLIQGARSSDLLREFCVISSTFGPVISSDAAHGHSCASGRGRSSFSASTSPRALLTRRANSSSSSACVKLATARR
jgi:hypothetical protein